MTKLTKQALRRIATSVQYTEGETKSNPKGQRTRKTWDEGQRPPFLTVKPIDQVTAGSTLYEYEIWDEEGATGESIDALWNWGVGSSTTMAADTECVAEPVGGWSDWLIVGWDCNGVSGATPGPLGDPPVATGTIDTATANFVTVESSGSTAASGLDITKVEWIFTLPSSEFLTIYGAPGAAPNYLWDSRGTLTTADIGTVITGDVDDMTIGEVAASISAPYTVTLIVTQTDEQQDSDEL